MKKRILICGLLSIFILLGVLYACKKVEEDRPNSANGLNSTQLVSSTQSAQKSAGIVTYYSKNHGDTVYKMMLTTDENGMVSIDRTIFTTSRPDTFRVRAYFGEGVSFTGYTFNPDSNRYYGDTIKVKAPIGKTYYVIPFMPGKNPESRTNAGVPIEYYCQCGCLNSEICAWCFMNGEGPSAECAGVCDLCDLIANCPDMISSGKVSHIGGVVVIDANGVDVIN